MARALGLDVGTKTIGLALSDEDRRLASPWLTLSRQGVKADGARLAALVRERGVDAVVVGLPLELDGGEQRSARLARQVGAEVERLTGIQPRFVDERYSSVEAGRRLIEGGGSRAHRKAVIDQAAAALVLQTWLDHGDAVTYKDGEED